MTKVNKPGSQKPGAGTTKKPEVKKPGTGASSSPGGAAKADTSAGARADVNRGKPGAKSRKSTVGGTAVEGARSTQPREVKAASPMEQQAEAYNREMRRRMQHMGAGPYAQSAADSMRGRRQKRIEKKKQRQEEVKKTVVTKGPSTNIKLGRRNTYFLLGLIGILLLIIILALIIRHPF